MTYILFLPVLLIRLSQTPCSMTFLCNFPETALLNDTNDFWEEVAFYDFYSLYAAT